MIIKNKEYLQMRNIQKNKFRIEKINNFKKDLGFEFGLDLSFKITISNFQGSIFN